MPFNSVTFLLFFGSVLGLHSLPLPWRPKKIVLLLASYLFYAAWNPPFVVLLWISTAVDWFAARLIAASDRPWPRRLALGFSLAVNLGLLGFFKYGDFLLANFVAVAGAVGVDYQPAALGVVLPVGISFYTFQSISYTVDVYRRQARPWPSLLDFALYVTFFPQLVAGPIVRSGDFLPQCRAPRRATQHQLGWGLELMLIGLFQKVVLADGLLAPVVERIYALPTPIDSASAWIGTLAFSGQIFCDFAGYSTCAIGVALCLGFALPDNFRFPYAAIGFSDFWRRWHISLSSWLRDYLYIPLGGNRLGVARTHLHLMLTMLLGGLWHGASWTFVVWGGLHGLYLVAERALKRSTAAGWALWRRLPGRLVLGSLTFALVCVAWTFFRADSLGQAVDMATAMLWPIAGPPLDPVAAWQALATLVVLAALLAVHWALRDTTLEAVARRVPALLWAPFNAAMLAAILMMPGEDRAFIYFQF